MFLRNCEYCGQEFHPVIGPQIYCCRECADAVQRKRVRENARKHKKIDRIKKVYRSALDDRLKELNEYNKQHGTHISYGEYMSMRERVW